MPEPPLLCVENVSRRDRLSGRIILDRVNMSLEHGERIGLVGKSGSGKSSLLRAIARLDRCDEGTVRFRGAIVAREAIPAFRRQVVYLPQRPTLLTGSVRSNLQIPFRLAVCEQERYDESIVARLLADLEMPLALLDQPAESLSGGEQQIIALIRAILLRPIVLLLDEPSASLDPSTTNQLEQLVLAWQHQGEHASSSQRTLIWTSHNEDQIARMTTRVLRIERGHLQSGPFQSGPGE